MEIEAQIKVLIDQRTQMQFGQFVVQLISLQAQCDILQQEIATIAGKLESESKID